MTLIFITFQRFIYISLISYDERLPLHSSPSTPDFNLIVLSIIFIMWQLHVASDSIEAFSIMQNDGLLGNLSQRRETLNDITRRLKQSLSFYYINSLFIICGLLQIYSNRQIIIVACTFAQ